MAENKISNGIREVKKTAPYTIPLMFVLSMAVSFGSNDFLFFLPFLTIIALITQFIFGLISFDKIELSKPKMILYFLLFLSMAVFSFSNLTR
jgi:hypothetical protein